jgi:hypothetical protein
MLGNLLQRVDAVGLDEVVDLLLERGDGAIEFSLLTHEQR